MPSHLCACKAENYPQVDGPSSPLHPLIQATHDPSACNGFLVVYPANNDDVMLSRFVFVVRIDGYGLG